MVPMGSQFADDATSTKKQSTFFLEAMARARASVTSSLKMVKKTGEDDPRRIIHAMKVGLALTAVSLLYYVNPLYESFGVNAMWAVLTVVVVMEYTVGGTLGKGLNRAVGTLVAGALGLGAHYLAALSGPKGEPIILGVMVFILAAAATFSRFLPEIKARFDYGAMIFILTFSLVAISSYRVDELLKLAHQRLSTIAIGGAVCMFISIFVFPVWAGEDLHKLIANNLDKLADSLEGLAVEHFGAKTESGQQTSLHVHKAVLNSKAMEETLTNLARWEPGHRRFGFRHPWKGYLEVGAKARQCAYYIEALNAHIAGSVEEEASPEIHGEIRSVYEKLCSESAKLFRDLAVCVRSMTQPSAGSYAVAVEAAMNDVKNAAKENAVVVALLCEIVSCTKRVAKSVEELALLANFRKANDGHHHGSSIQPISEDEDAYHVINIKQ